jgi:predicted transcriptional regulator
MNELSQNLELLYRVKEIVAAYVSNNSLPASDLPKLIVASHAALHSLADPRLNTPASVDPLFPAVPIKKSVTPDRILCLECGKSFTSIKRHLANDHELTPQQYRTKWDLPEGYPMVAPAYSVRRSMLAKESGLGRNRRRRTAV